MPNPAVAQWMLVIAVLWLVYQFALRAMKCRYCGKVNDHEPHCPFQNSGMTGA